MAIPISVSNGRPAGQTHPATRSARNRLSTRRKVAVAGAGIYGATTALRLSQAGYDVTLYDPLGVMYAASAINQYRVHSGYHYPRSPETIEEILEARDEFIATYSDAIVQTTKNYYAIPHRGSLTSPETYEAVFDHYGLRLTKCRPDWMNFDFIQVCYEVDEFVYDPSILRDIITSRLKNSKIKFEKKEFTYNERRKFDFFVSTTYGLGPSKGMFNIAKFQVAEKILIKLPSKLHSISLVVVDGPFTAFDPYGASQFSLFGSAKHTNHWVATSPDTELPTKFSKILNRPDFSRCEFSNFERMRSDGALAVPLVAQAEYIGSRFTIRVVENDPLTDRRILYIRESSPGDIHVFSGKVICAVKAARLVEERLNMYV